MIASSRAYYRLPFLTIFRVVQHAMGVPLSKVQPNRDLLIIPKNCVIRSSVSTRLIARSLIWLGSFSNFPQLRNRDLQPTSGSHQHSNTTTRGRPEYTTFRLIKWIVIKKISRNYEIFPASIQAR
jgi:hypothetical protein